MGLSSNRAADQLLIYGLVVAIYVAKGSQIKSYVVAQVRFNSVN